MANLSSSIFEVGRKYSAIRFLWLTSKISRCTRRDHNFTLTLLFNEFFNRFSSCLLGEPQDMFTEEFIQSELKNLDFVLRHIAELQNEYNRWCRCVRCYEKRLRGYEDDISDKRDSFLPPVYHAFEDLTHRL